MNFHTAPGWEPSLTEKTDADMLPGDRMELATLTLRRHHRYQVGKLR